MQAQPLVPVLDARSHHAALILASRLSGEGLHPFMPSGDFVTETVEPIGYAVVTVPETELDEAQDIVAAWDARARDE